MRAEKPIIVAAIESVASLDDLPAAAMIDMRSSDMRSSSDTTWNALAVALRAWVSPVSGNTRRSPPVLHVRRGFAATANYTMARTSRRCDLSATAVDSLPSKVTGVRTDARTGLSPHGAIRCSLPQHQEVRFAGSFTSLQHIAVFAAGLLIPRS